MAHTPEELLRWGQLVNQGRYLEAWAIDDAVNARDAAPQVTVEEIERLQARDVLATKLQEENEKLRRALLAERAHVKAQRPAKTRSTDGR